MTKYLAYLTAFERSRYDGLTQQINELKAKRVKLIDLAQGRGYYAEVWKGRREAAKP